MIEREDGRRIIFILEVTFVLFLTLFLQEQHFLRSGAEQRNDTKERSDNEFRIERVAERVPAQGSGDELKNYREGGERNAKFLRCDFLVTPSFLHSITYREIK